jgi:hypothetical protein
MAPFPNCFSMDERASSRALFFALFSDVDVVVFCLAILLLLRLIKRAL